MGVSREFLEPGSVVRHRDGALVVLKQRKPDNTGWWNMDGSGLADRVLEGDDWELASREYIENVALAIAPWDDKTIISRKWLDWDRGVFDDAEKRGPFVIISANTPEIATHIVGLWNNSGVSVPEIPSD